MQLVNIEGKRFKSIIKGAVREALEGIIEKEESAPIVVSARFTILPDGWTRDKEFGIDWAPSSKERMKLSEAEKYCASMGGRLPTSKELASLLDHSRQSPAIVEPFVKDTKSEWYWTSTRCVWDSSCAWCVGFSSGCVGSAASRAAATVRVRVAPASTTIKLFDHLRELRYAVAISV